MEKDLLEKMYLIRETESQVAKLHTEGKLRGTDHFSTGQEAIPVGLLSQTSSHDIVTCGHRVYHVALAQGLEPSKIFAELLGKSTGYNKGYAGIMHLSSKENNFWGANGIVGANIALSSGIALGLKYQKKKGIVITFFGDGSTTQGIFHESLNMASLWNLPILFVCENNYWAQSTSLDEHSAITNIAKKVKDVYNIDSIRVDGTDINSIIKVSRSAIEKVRKGKPFLIEFMVYRTSGHSLNDKEKIYFTKEYKQKAEKNDPIKRYERYLLKKRILTHQQIEKLKERAKNYIQTSLVVANNAKETSFHDLEGLL